MLKYQLIANQIESHIYENNLPKGTKLPTVEQFASDYSVSKSTIGIFSSKGNCLSSSR